VIVCTPVACIADYVREVVKHCPEGTLITDAGSTSRPLSRRLTKDCREVAASWVAILGRQRKERRCLRRLRTVRGRVAIITPTKNTRAEDYDCWKSSGSAGVGRHTHAAAEHDRAVAFTSHLRT